MPSNYIITVRFFIKLLLILQNLYTNIQMCNTKVT